jgi:hypothetical protein
VSSWFIIDAISRGPSGLIPAISGAKHFATDA